jgi:rhodanese-related sulfurtransferase
MGSRLIRSLAADQLDAIEKLARAYLGAREELEVIDGEELEERLRRGDVVLIDVRPETEYAAGHLPGAMSVPPDELDRLEGALADLPPGREVVAYCRGPYCVYADDAIRYLAMRGSGQ